MRRITLLLSSIAIAAALFTTSGTRAESISQILNRYYACDNSYNYDMTHSPDGWAGDCRSWNDYGPAQCLFDPNPENCIESYRTTCVQNAFSNYSSCVSDIGEHREEENFCDHAREIRDYCEASLYATEDLGAFSSCIASSGIWQCE